MLRKIMAKAENSRFLPLFMPENTKKAPFQVLMVETTGIFYIEYYIKYHQITA